VAASVAWLGWSRIVLAGVELDAQAKSSHEVIDEGIATSRPVGGGLEEEGE
jgi:hypothetical protein